MAAPFSESDQIKRLLELSGELSDIATASGVLSWDQEVMMPPKGALTRAYSLATLAGIYHDKLTHPAVRTLISDAKEKVVTDADKALVREFEREYEKSTKLPRELVKQLSETASRAFDSWQTAKKNNTFSTYAPILGQLLELRLQAARLVQSNGQTIYDTMLDDYEPGLTETEVDRVFTTVREPLVALVEKISPVAQDSDKKVVGKHYDATAQWSFGIQLLTDMGYDFDAGRQDKSAHPFTINFSPHDVRVTTWGDDESDPRPALFATIHEGGHALYEQGCDTTLTRTHVAGGQGLVLHESQSRLWENIIGRSVPFWKHYYPILQTALPALKGVSEHDFVKAVNCVKPSFIRVEADELTYGLHIILRFEIEKLLVNQQIKVSDLPQVWNQKMHDYLGITPQSDREGVLQDVHWSHGSFGYFPTYFLGTMTSSQLWNSLQTQLNLRDTLGPEQLKLIRIWLKEHLHIYGKLYEPKQLLLKITGKDLNPQYFIDYLEQKYSTLYLS